MVKHRSLRALRKVKVAPKKKKGVTAGAPLQQSKNIGNDADFHSMMKDVVPLKGKGRTVTLHDRPKPSPACPPREHDVLDSLRRIVEGESEFELEFSGEYMQGHVRGLDSALLRNLKAGSLSMEAHVDLHGLNLEQARSCLLDFIKDAYISGKRGVLVVTGRGKGSLMGIPVIKQEVQHWLTQEPLRRVVLAFCSALPKEGGVGAMYVLIRKYKRNFGKVRWERDGFFREM